MALFAGERRLWSGRASAVTHLHTLLGGSAFVLALLIALALHYHKVVKNGVAAYPDEWWPSVSATIGDWYPERNVFQIFIAMTSGPRFLLVGLCSLLVALQRSSRAAWVLLVVGLLRTVACGGWVYITSSDDHDVHDVAMGAYIALTVPWMWICVAQLPDGLAPSVRPGWTGRKMRALACASFFSCTPFMCYFFYQHKVLEVPGMYSIYSCFEWGLILTDIAFDAASAFDLRHITLHVGYVSDATAELIPSGKGSPLETLRSPMADGASVATVAAVATNREEVCAPAQPVGALRTYAALISDVYWQFLFWTSTTSVLPTIFFFSVYNLSIGGEEAVVLFQTLVFAVLSLPIFRKAFFTGGSVRVDLLGSPLAGIKGPSHASARIILIHLMELPALACWGVQSPHARLFLTTLAAAAAAVRTNLQWGHASLAHPRAVRDQVVRFLAGLLLTMLAKYACFGNHPLAPFMRPTSPHAGNPMGLKPEMLRLGMNNGEGAGEGPHGGWNRIGLVLALLAFAERSSRPGNTLNDASVPEDNKKTHTGSALDWRKRLLLVLGSGAALYTLPMYLSDSGTLISWTWTGYPIRGPTALEHGWIVLGAFAVGVYLSSRPLSRSAVTAASAITTFSLLWVYKVDDWPAFLPLLLVPLCLPSAVVHVLTGAVEAGVGFPSAAGAWLVYALLTFCQVLTVAYAFVPVIGPLLREHSGGMILLSQALLSAVAYACAPASATRPALEQAGTNADKGDHDSLSGEAPSVSSEAGHASSAPAEPRPKSSYGNKVLGLFLVLVSLLSLPIPYWHKPVIQPPGEVQEAHRTVTVGIHTVHFGLDQEMWESGTRLSDLYLHSFLDVVGLLETDLQRVVYGNRDLTQWLSYRLGMYADMGPGPNKHTWGAILLSRFPIINTTHHLLPSPQGELAPAIQAWLDVYGVETMVWVSHNGQEEDALDRELQSTAIAKELSLAFPHPTVFLGYLVTEPHAPRPSPYGIVVNEGRMLDVDPSDEDRWCQYIFYRAIERVASARISRYTVSDTELQTAKFRIPPVGHLIDPTREDRTVRVRESGFPMPMLYFPDLWAPTALVYGQHMYFPNYLPSYYASPDRALLDYPPKYSS